MVWRGGGRVNHQESDDPRGGGNAPTGASRFCMLVCHPKGDDTVTAMMLVGGGSIMRVFVDGAQDGWSQLSCTRFDYTGEDQEGERMMLSFEAIASRAGLEEIPADRLESQGLYEIIESTS